MSLAEVMFEYVSPILAILIVVANTIEITMLIRQKQRNKFNAALVYVFGLSLSDLLVGMTIVCTKIVYFIIKMKLFSDSIVLEKMIHVFKYLFLRMSLFISIFSLLAITVDRNRAMNASVRRTPKCAVMLSAVWEVNKLVVVDPTTMKLIG